MDNENFGETSKKKSPDTSDSDRPLKKARYLWQVKGKYHLKDNVKILNTNSPTVDEGDKTESNGQVNNLENNNLHENDVNAINVNNNIVQARNKNLCSDRSCIEALIANSDKIMDFPEPESPPKNIDKSISDEIPITLVKPNPKNGDYYLRKWQARQIAKGFVDNTINRVLESWMIAPFDAADFVENCDNGGQVEDEGILMAIQSHGLQSGTREILQRIGENESSLQGSSRSKSLNSASKSSWEVVTNCTCTNTRREIVQNHSLTPFHHRTEINDMSLEYYENLCVLKDTEPIRSNFVVSHSFSDKPSASLNSEDSVEIDSSSIPSEMDSETITDNSTNYESLKMDDTDFLDAAVAVAIQKKGLTSFNCVDCG